MSRALQDSLRAMVALDEELAATNPGFMCETMPAVTDDGWCEWIHPLPGYLMQCCDCNLVHEVQFQIGARSGEGELNPGEGDDGVVIFRMRRWRDADA